MGKIKGIDIILIKKKETGKDPFRKPIYVEEEITIHNVLVSPASSEEVINELNLTGKRLEYILGIPKGDDHVWEDQEVRLFGKRYRTFGPVEEGIESQVPLHWHKKIRVERYE